MEEAAARYLKIVEWSDEDGCFVGRCPGLFHGGCHGDDEAAVYKELCVIVREHIACLLADKKDFPPPTAMILDWDNCPEVSRHPWVMSGSLVFKHTRLPVSSLFGNLADGTTLDEFMESYPPIEKERIEAVLDFVAKSLDEKQDDPHWHWLFLKNVENARNRADGRR